MSSGIFRLCIIHCFVMGMGFLGYFFLLTRYTAMSLVGREERRLVSYISFGSGCLLVVSALGDKVSLLDR
jgi:hypothetical protein